MDGLKVLAFDTGGTIIDWHGGITAALAECGGRRDVGQDWHELANEYRRRALRRMLGAVDPHFNIDDVHREILDELLGETGIAEFSDAERQTISARWHALDAWPDFVPALARLRQRYICVSFTILSLALVVDVSRRNAIDWDAVITCEMLGVYKPRPEAYRRAAQFLQTAPGDILMVRGEGYRTAFVHRPAEWGPSGPPDPTPSPATDLVVSGFAELADRLGT